MSAGPVCEHPDSELDECLGDPDWAYCFGCACVLRKVNDEWVAQGRTITKASYRYG